MTSIDALRLAIRNEVGTLELYRDFCVKHPELSEIFLFLVNEEEKHKKLLEKKITELTKF